ncbi:YrrS family protein [Alkalibacterium sp.]|nr:MAG: DUF1510 family protein [Alkalibacterium sp.]
MRQTRTKRKNNTTPEPPKDPKNKNPEYIYYAIIGLLLIILIGIAVFIFSNRDTATDSPDNNGAFDSEELTDSENDDNGIVIDENDDADDEDDEESEDDNDEQDTDTSDDEETEDTEEADDSDDADEEPEDEPQEEADTDEDTDAEADNDSEFTINEDAPLDESYVPNYADGSSDRNAIASAVASVTGLNQSDMITWRVGNNGPGRVFAVMSDSGQNEVYRTFLQYGEGEWHVTAYEELSEVPSEFR